MTKVQYMINERQIMLRVQGHAGYNPGNDIVCAGISTIVQSFVFTCEQYASNGKCHIQLDRINEKLGSVVFQITFPKDEYTTFKSMFDMLLIGLRAIEDSFPAFLLIKE